MQPARMAGARRYTQEARDRGIGKKKKEEEEEEEAHWETQLPQPL